MLSGISSADCNSPDYVLVMQDHFKQRLMHADASLVTDKAKFPKAIHEEADTRACRAYHLRQGLLGDLGNQRLGFPRLTKLRHQQEYARQALLAVIEQLIDQIGLRPHAMRKQESQKQVGERMFAMHDTSHLRAIDLECCTRYQRGRSSYVRARHRRNRLFSNKVSCR